MAEMITVDCTEALAALSRIQAHTPEFRSGVRKLVRQTLKGERKTFAQLASAAAETDPRRTMRQGVAMTVYKRLLGGNINLYGGMRKTLKERPYTPRLREGQRGGNRRPKRVPYRFNAPAILSSINFGTTARGSRYGYRGRVQGKYFFANAEGSMKRAAEAFAKEVEDFIEELWGTDTGNSSKAAGDLI